MVFDRARKDRKSVVGFGEPGRPSTNGGLSGALIVREIAGSFALR